MTKLVLGETIKKTKGKPSSLIPRVLELPITTFARRIILGYAYTQFFLFPSTPAMEKKGSPIEAKKSHNIVSWIIQNKEDMGSVKKALSVAV